jgi:hypothetical protein
MELEIPCLAKEWTTCLSYGTLVLRRGLRLVDVKSRFCPDAPGLESVDFYRIPYCGTVGLQ